jgi:hypothetical protein
MNSTSKMMLIALTLAAAQSMAQSEPEISISSETVSVGGIATVDLSISGLGSGTQLGAYDLNIAYNPSIVSFNSALFGDPKLGDELNLEGYGTLSAAQSGSGTVEVQELSFDSIAALETQQASAFTLVQLSFDARAVGSSSLDLSINAVSDAYGDALTPGLSDGSITVKSSGTTAAPEIDPGHAAGALTLLAGSLAIARARMRRFVTQLRNPRG